LPALSSLNDWICACLNCVRHACCFKHRSPESCLPKFETRQHNQGIDASGSGAVGGDCALSLSAPIRWVLGIGIVLTVLWVATRQTFFVDTISSPFLAIALFSIFLILLRTHTSVEELGGILAITGLAYLIDIDFLGFPYRWPVIASFVGLASLCMLAARAIWAPVEKRRLALFTVIPAFLFVASEWFASYFLQWGEKARPMVLDLFLYSFDASLGIQPAVLVGQWFARSVALATVSELVYLGLPIAIGLTFAGCLMRDRANAMPALVAFLITGPVGACFYTLFPALGPAHILHANFPWHTLTMDQARHLLLEPIAVAGPRNAIPSLHATWIFLVFWYARKLSLWERSGAAFFLFFTLAATLGTAEHYFIDLVVAAPFSLR